MPIIKSTYKAPWYIRNTHIATIYPSQWRKVEGVQYARERIDTPDNDFLDLDWSKNGSEHLAVLLHGFEGNASRPYMLGMVKHLNHAGWDTLSMNLRGCSGEPNKQLATYHAGKTDDVELVIRHAQNQNSYKKTALVGFSLGGNLAVKLLKDYPSLKLNAVVAISTPLDLVGGAKRMEEKQNWIYNNRFKVRLMKKVESKRHLLTKEKYQTLQKVKSLTEFDDEFTAPLFGFKNALDYQQKNSNVDSLSEIQTPTLLLQAQNDTFLTKSCFPYDVAKKSDHLYLETPELGGHCGFWAKKNLYYSEKRTAEFIASF